MASSADSVSVQPGSEGKASIQSSKERSVSLYNEMESAPADLMVTSLIRIVTALKAGYTHLDLAEGYANEESIGAALKEYSGKREDLWITEKILGGMADIKGTLKKQLKDVSDRRVYQCE